MYNELLFFSYVWLTLAAVGIVAKAWHRQKLLAKFASSAPPTPSWFNPVFPEQPKGPGTWRSVFGSYSNHPKKDLFLTAYDEVLFCFTDGYDKLPMDLIEEIEEHELKQQEFDQQLIVWQQSRETAKNIQWRKHYAKKMMEELY